MFQNLTTDELRSLMAAIMTPGRRGFTSNRICRMLVGTQDQGLRRSYNELADEIVNLHSEIADVLISSYRAAA